MRNEWTRRSLLRFAAVAVPASGIGLGRLTALRIPGGEGALKEGQTNQTHSSAGSATDLFPTQPPELVREMVTVAHYDLKRVKELVEARPSLARAAWDWGFGDWEDALGAASHMGNRAMAEYLISKGGRPTIFSATMLGQLEIVKGFVAAQPGVQAIRGPHSISLLAHARMGGETARPVFEFLQSSPDSDSEAPVALPENETASLVGTYAFGAGASEQIVVDADLRMYAGSKMYTHAPQLNWTRKGTMGRPLFHLGDHTFCPAGAPSARIRFTENAAGVLMTITDADFLLTARRKAKVG
ncbi:MAG TPA: hypothetical protein VJN90_04445 [Candidatus Acidoferrales bacterium]|nr:hypothetical protein [Candidatus Acidoferrales bacterium]